MLTVNAEISLSLYWVSLCYEQHRWVFYSYSVKATVSGDFLSHEIVSVTIFCPLHVMKAVVLL